MAPDDGSAEPQWPTAPQWTRPGTTRELPTTLAGRPIVPQDNASALWAASAREVLTGWAEPRGAGRGGAGHAPAVRELRPLALSERPVLPPLRHPPGLSLLGGRDRHRRTRALVGRPAPGSGSPRSRTRVQDAPNSSTLKLIDSQARIAKNATKVP